MCVWQSQAPAGTSKCTGVAGWDAVAWLVRGRRRAPVASAPTRMARRVSIGGLLVVGSVRESYGWCTVHGQEHHPALSALSYHRTVLCTRREAWSCVSGMNACTY